MPRMTKAEREKRAKMDAKNARARELRAERKAAKDKQVVNGALQSYAIGLQSATQDMCDRTEGIEVMTIVPAEPTFRWWEVAAMFALIVIMAYYSFSWVIHR